LRASLNLLWMTVHTSPFFSVRIIWFTPFVADIPQPIIFGPLAA
jgi:hypothetical protein